MIKKILKKNTLMDLIIVSIGFGLVLTGIVQPVMLLVYLVLVSQLVQIVTGINMNLYLIRTVLLRIAVVTTAGQNLCNQVLFLILIGETIVYCRIGKKFYKFFSGTFLAEKKVYRFIQTYRYIIYYLEPILFLVCLLLLNVAIPAAILAEAILVFYIMYLLILGYNWKKKGSPIYTKIQRYLAEEYKPVHLLYFSAPEDSTYQVRMWMKYLERLPENIYILTREAHHLTDLRKITSVPIICCKNLNDIESFLPESLRTVFYVNNGMKNSQMIRIGRLIHIQLLHGDSDKASSYNPLASIYDKIFVSGRAGIDRYIDHGIMIPPEKFEIIGRPQVEGLKVVSAHSEVKTILYLTTWPGFYQDVAFCSIPQALHIIEELKKIGYRVLFKPHPYTYKFPEAKKSALEIKELLKEDYIEPSSKKPLSYYYNLSDCLISDISSVMNEYLFTEKPIIATNVNNYTEEDLIKESNTIGACYVLNQEGSNIASIMKDIHDTDSKKSVRTSFKEYYLSNIEKPHEYFINTIQRYLDE